MIIGQRQDGNEIVLDLSVSCDEIDKSGEFAHLYVKSVFLSDIGLFLAENYQVKNVLDSNRFGRTIEMLGETAVVDDKGVHWEYRARFKFIVNMTKTETIPPKGTRSKNK